MCSLVHLSVRCDGASDELMRAAITGHHDHTELNASIILKTVVMTSEWLDSAQGGALFPAPGSGPTFGACGPLSQR